MQVSSALFALKLDQPFGPNLVDLNYCFSEYGTVGPE